MAKEQDRHKGIRENVWFPESEHAEMVHAMKLIMEDKKSVFIRTAVHNLVKHIQEGGNNDL